MACGEGNMTIDDLEAELRKLSDADFSVLARRLGFTAPPPLQWAQVEIDDDQEDPIAVLEYPDGSKQKIDIFAAIRDNIMIIGNPIMLIAIHHWYETLRHRAALTFKDAWDDLEGVQGESNRAIRKWLFSGRPDIALKNLSRISQTIIDDANKRRVSREQAFVALVQEDGYDQKTTLLYEAFVWLRNDKTRNENQRLTKLEAALRKVYVSNHIISIERVMSFLRSDKGKRQIYPKTWVAMRNAFLAWLFNLTPYTVVRYFSTARKNNKNDDKINTRFLLPKFNRYQVPDLGGWFLRLSAVVPNKAYLADDEE